MRDIYYKFEPQNLESNHFSNTLIVNDLYFAFHILTTNCIGGEVVSVMDSYFGGRGFETAKPTFMLISFYFL